MFHVTVMQTRVCTGRCCPSTVSEWRNVVLSADPSWINPVCPLTSYVLQISCYLRWVSFVLLLPMTSLFDVTASLCVTHVFAAQYNSAGSSQFYDDMFSAVVGRNSAVGIATGYGLGGRGIESQWGRDFPHPSRSALEPTQPPIQGQK